MRREVVGLSLAGAALILIFREVVASRSDDAGPGLLAVGVALFMLLVAFAVLGSGRTRV